MTIAPSRQSILALAQLFLLTAPALAQTANDPPAAPLAYAGADTHVGVGYDNRTKLRGEVGHVFSADDKSAWLGEIWVGDQAGGLQLDYHWQVEDESRVAKVFAAWDRNQWNDQKLTLGTGAEYPSWFWGAYLSSALTGARQAGIFTRSATETRDGVDASGPYRQDFTTTTTTQTYQQAYDYGIGVRLGHFYEDALLRLTVGADHEWGQASSRQSTLSVGVEKYFAGSPHSIMVIGSIANRSGDFESRQDERRIGIYWRYEFDGKNRNAWRASKNFHKVAVPAAEPMPTLAATSAEPKKQIVKVSELVAAETFFDLDHSTLRPQATKLLDDLAERVRKASLQGPLQITGHTCNLGSAAYNQHLSERRATAVREYLVNTAGLPSDGVTANGRGMDDPKYPNTRQERHLNRRCEIEFTVVTDQIAVVAAKPAAAAAVAPGAPSWRYEEEAVPSPWVERALRNPVSHKREVDVYQTSETSTTVIAGTRVYLNRPPVAVDDVFSWFGRQMPAILDVLANDSDPDGNKFHIVSATNGARGTVTVLADGHIRYLWNFPKEGVDHFSYTIADQFGATSTANVTLTVIDP